MYVKEEELTDLFLSFLPQLSIYPGSVQIEVAVTGSMQIKVVLTRSVILVWNPSIFPFLVLDPMFRPPPAAVPFWGSDLLIRLTAVYLDYKIRRAPPATV